MFGLWILNDFTLKVDTDENKIRFPHWIYFYFRNDKMFYKWQKIYVPYMQMLLQLKLLVGSFLLGSVVENMIEKPENFLPSLPADNDQI